MANPDIASWETPNGARVYFVRAAELPMVDVRVVFDAGSARDGAHGGLAALTNGMLDEGAGGVPAEIISERFEELGAGYDNGAARDMAWVNLRSLTDASVLEPALANLRLLLEHPDFPEVAFERERKRMLVTLQQRQQNPAEVASDAFYAAVYPGHPYASPVYGTEQTLGEIERTDLAVFFRRYYTARNAVVAIVGDIDHGQADALARRLVDKLPEGGQAEPLPAVQALAAPIEVKVGHTSTQTHILVGAPALARLDPEFFALYVGNHALGGSGLVSRLSDVIRERRGLSYSVYSHFLPMRVAGPFIAGLETRNEQAKEALGLLRGTLKGFLVDGPTDQELKSSINNIVAGFPLRIDSNSKILEYLVLIGFYDLPLDYLDRFTQEVRAVTPAQVRAAFRRRLSPEKLVTVIVGAQEAVGQGEAAPRVPASARAHRR